MATQTMPIVIAPLGSPPPSLPCSPAYDSTKETMPFPTGDTMNLPPSVLVHSSLSTRPKRVEEEIDESQRLNSFGSWLRSFLPTHGRPVF